MSNEKLAKHVMMMLYGIFGARRRIPAHAVSETYSLPTLDNALVYRMLTEANSEYVDQPWMKKNDWSYCS